MRFYLSETNILQQPKVFFTISVKDYRWFARITRDHGKANPFAPDYEEVFCDGAYIYYLLNIESAVTRKRARAEKVGQNIATAWARPGEVWNDRCADELGAIWLAFASQCFFESRTSDIIEPPIAFDAIGGQFGGEQSDKLRAEWKLSSATPHLPTEVTYYNPGFQRFPGKIMPLPPPYENGFKDAAYSVQLFTNCYGMTFPAQATLSIFKPKSGGTGSNDLQMLVVYEVAATNVLDKAVLNLHEPRIPGNTSVYDKRYAVQSYHATNRWPTVAELKTGRYYKMLRGYNSQPGPQGGASSSRKSH